MLRNGEQTLKLILAQIERQQTCEWHQSIHSSIAYGIIAEREVGNPLQTAQNANTTSATSGKVIGAPPFKGGCIPILRTAAYECIIDVRDGRIAPGTRVHTHGPAER
jgi:hypothetical protein